MLKDLKQFVAEAQAFLLVCVGEGGALVTGYRSSFDFEKLPFKELLSIFYTFSEIWTKQLDLKLRFCFCRDLQIHTQLRRKTNWSESQSPTDKLNTLPPTYSNSFMCRYSVALLVFDLE